MMVKMWRGYQKKISDDDKIEIKSLKKQGWTYKRLAEKFGVSITTISYHLNPAVKVGTIEGVRRRRALKKHTYRDKEKRREYMKQYMKERYHDDPEFRERIKEYHRRYNVRKRFSICLEEQMELDTLNEVRVVQGIEAEVGISPLVSHKAGITTS